MEPIRDERAAKLTEALRALLSQANDDGSFSEAVVEAFDDGTKRSDVDLWTYAENNMLTNDSGLVLRVTFNASDSEEDVHVFNVTVTSARA